MTLHVLLIGDATRPEFDEACAALDEVACVKRAAGVQEATAAMAEGPLAPHGIVLVQTYPGQYSAAAIDRLRAAAPLARLIALLGSWCEGEPRSGRPLPGVVRIYWHEAAARFRREFACPFAARSAWSLPGTATDEERLLASIDSSMVPASGAAPGERLVAIWTRRREMAELLADACRAGGYATAWLHPRLPAQVRGVAAAIVDCDALDAGMLHEIRRLAERVSPARMLVLLPAPRIQDARLARTLGAAVLAKPFRVDELLWLLKTEKSRSHTPYPGSHAPRGNVLAGRSAAP